jgi:hypothetical protein
MMLAATDRHSATDPQPNPDLPAEHVWTQMKNSFPRLR